MGRFGQICSDALFGASVAGLSNPPMNNESDNGNSTMKIARRKIANT